MYLHCFEKILEDRQVFPNLFLHGLFQFVLICLEEIDYIGLRAHIDLRNAVGSLEGVGSVGLQWTGKGPESEFAVRLILGHLERAEIPAAHQVAYALKKRARVTKTLRKRGRLQCSILPLKIVSRRAHKIEDQSDGFGDHCAKI